jgi:DNA-binding CsgD family transcriptional regulator
MLVGRDREQRVIDRMLAGARDGHSGVLAVVGEAGIGKSALLEHAARHASGMSVLRARGTQSEAHIPFAGLFELLRPAIGAVERIPGPQAAALEGALALRPAHSVDRFAIGAATLSLLAAYAEQAPLLVLIDDAHWLDGSSANALLFACRRLLADPIVVFLTVREGEPSLLDGADLERLHLEGLDGAASTELLRRHTSTALQADIAERLHRETGGNPLALLELVEERDLLQKMPLHGPLPVVTSVANAYVQRFQSLAANTQGILVLTAASDGCELSVLARAAPGLGLDLGDLAPAEAAGLVTLEAGRVEWCHPLARSAVYGEALPARRREVHRALANALPDADDDRRAWHLALAALGPDDAASSALEQAGGRARDRSAYDVSSRAFERAAFLAPDTARKARLLHAAAEAAWLGGLADRAGDLVDEARRHNVAPEMAISIEHLRGHIATRRGSVKLGETILLAAAEQAVAVDPPRAVVMFAEAVNAAFYAGEASAMRSAAERVVTVAKGCSDGRSVFFATMTKGMAFVFSGDGDRGARLIRNAVTQLEASDELSDDLRLIAWAVMGAVWLREAATGRALVDRALTAARSRSAVGVLPFLLSHVAIDRAASDRWPEAEAAFYEAIGLARESGQHTELATSLARLSWLEARQGKEENCRAHNAEALALSRELGLGPCEIWSLSALGDLELGLGQPEAAMVRFEEQEATRQAGGMNDVDLSPAPELVELYLRLGRVLQASEAADAFEREAVAKAQPWALARAARCRGLVVGEDEFEGCFAEAIARHDETPDLFEAARTRLAYGSRLRRSRQRVRAREQLRAAIDIFDRLGAEPWSQFSRAELAATGETARQRNPTTLYQLTPQELQIALLLAERRTTRETAAALFLSPKTVEYHLRSIYRKLGIGSRDELVAAMARLPSVSAPAV